MTAHFFSASIFYNPPPCHQQGDRRSLARAPSHIHRRVQRVGLPLWGGPLDSLMHCHRNCCHRNCETVELELIDDLVEGDNLDEFADDAENEEVAA